MTIKIIACAVMKEELLAVQRPAASEEIEFRFLPMGLHLHPEKLHQELQESLNHSKEYSRIILGFGLCGGAANELKVLDCGLTIPRVHDCIPILIGSKSLHQQCTKQNPGTFYLSGGWMEGEQSLIKDYQRLCQKVGPEEALEVLSELLANYQRFIYIHTNHPRYQRNLEDSHKLAKLVNLTHQIFEGNDEFFRKIVNGPWDNQDFINIDPGGIIDEEYFSQ